MKKKILESILVLSMIALFVSAICFASTENVESTDLGNDITSSIEASEKSVGNVTGRNADAGDDIADDAKDVGNAVKNGAEDVKNAVEDGVEEAGNMVEDGKEKVENATNELTDDVEEDKNAVSGETSNFTSGESTDNADEGMSTRTWMWIIIAVVAVIIIAAVWYYAANKND